MVDVVTALAVVARESAAESGEPSVERKAARAEVPTSKKRLRILTVGDGDLTLSLAIVRCYDVDHVDLIATSIVPSREALIGTYPQTAPATLNELEVAYGVDIRYGVDACLLHQYAFHDDESSLRSRPFDIAIFQHPHLGDYHAEEMDLLTRHCSLLAHYLSSAKAVANYVHVTLCANQPDSWQLLASATRAGLVLASKVPVQNPFHQIFPPDDSFPWSTDPHWQSSYQRNFESGDNIPNRRRQVVSRRRGGSMNWMGRLGYSHVRTTQAKSSLAAAPMLAGSMHYVFKHDTKVNVQLGEEGDESVSGCPLQSERATLHTCPVCHISFTSCELLASHLDAPALPVAQGLGDTNFGTAKNEHYQDETTVLNEKSLPASSSDMSIETGIDTGNSGNNRPAGSGGPVVDESGVDESGNSVWTVSSENVGKRLRWYLQHVAGAQSAVKRSKREWDQMLKDGRIAINGDIVTDSSRIMQQPGWKVTVLVESGASTGTGRSSASELEPQIELCTEWVRNDVGSLAVVWKPVGMRAIGSFDSSTLEETFSRQQQGRTGLATKYASLSKLDKGCSGLCVLQPVTRLLNDQWQDLVITHTFAALVHGHALEEWKVGKSIRLSLDGVRRWKKPAQEQGEDDSTLAHAVFDVQVICLEQTSSDRASNVPALSTISITTTSKSSRLAQSIAYYLRKSSKQPVVGDRVAVQEYLSLPRSMRNRIKQRFCIGCTQISVTNATTGEHHEQTCPLPQKWSARYWQQFCSASTPTESSLPFPTERSRERDEKLQADSTWRSGST